MLRKTNHILDRFLHNFGGYIPSSAFWSSDVLMQGRELNK